MRWMYFSYFLTSASDIPLVPDFLLIHQASRKSRHHSLPKGTSSHGFNAL